MQIKIKYFNDSLTRIEKLSQGNWLDLRSAETVTLKAGEFRLIHLGVAMELPSGFEAIVASRSSTFKNFGILQANSIGVIDNSYKGNNDEWRFPAYAVRDTTIQLNDRICQFRIQEIQPDIEFVEVEMLENEDRSGFGSTGIR